MAERSFRVILLSKEAYMSELRSNPPIYNQVGVIETVVSTLKEMPIVYICWLYWSLKAIFKPWVG